MRSTALGEHVGSASKDVPRSNHARSPDAPKSAEAQADNGLTGWFHGSRQKGLYRIRTDSVSGNRLNVVETVVARLEMLAETGFPPAILAFRLTVNRPASCLR